MQAKAINDKKNFSSSSFVLMSSLEAFFNCLVLFLVHTERITKKLI